MEKITLPLDIVAIKSGELYDSLPEFYELKNAIENSKDGWHQQESVFDHTLSVVHALKKIISNHKGLEKILNQKIDENTKETLLETAAIFHDIGKKEAMVTQDGFTKCLDHEKIGKEKGEKIFERFNLSKKEADHILNIITNHSCFHKLLMPDNQNFQKDLEDIKNLHQSIYPELILLSYADTINSKLKEVNPKEFNNRIDFYEKETQNLSR